ncbi:MAG: 2Fe-2S iron-sulfur cluster-binding protein [Bacillota bacterium]
MINMVLNGLEISVEEGTTVLEAARFYGIEIPTLCYDETLSPYGACRLCLVEIGEPGKARLFSACTYPAREGITVKTNTKRVINARRMIIELYLATCSSSKKIQDLASEYGVTEVRFTPKNEECILCGLCVRMCEEQMQAKAIGFIERGVNRYISTPFDRQSEDCRLCGACMYICPVCQVRCQGPQEEETICNACLNLFPPCLENYDQAMCYMDPCVACELEKQSE